MSHHYAPAPNSGLVAYGFDHALGYFIDVYDVGGTVIETKCTAFDGLTHGHLLQLLDDAGAQVPEAHRELIAMDLPV